MQDSTSIHPAILYEPDGYRTDVAKLMGRQAAGSGFLRAAVDAARHGPVFGYTPRKTSLESFARTVREFDPLARPVWVNPARPEQLRQVGHLYLPGPGLEEEARSRLRVGADAWSLTGVTHTTASHAVMDSLTRLPLAPLMPWDAIVCTSDAVLQTVRTVLEAQRDYLQWRLAAPISWTLPQLPVIPLGVHCADYETSAQERSAARQELGLAEDEVAALFVGRISFHGKAHPHAMYAALQEAALRTGRRLVLIQCGWFANEYIERAFREGAARMCPQVRCLFTDGRQPQARRSSWAAADIFVSLSDNIQETFGLTPIEAMAAGLPVVATDWNGYKDTVRDGLDGYRIPTWMAPPGTGEGLAAAYESGADSYDMYCGLACQHVALDHRMLADRLSALALDAGLRQALGAAGQVRARQVFDWSVVYRRYQDLWAELDGIRRAGAGAAQGAPRVWPGRLDPFISFSHYPTYRVGPGTRVSLSPGASAEAFMTLAGLDLYSYARRLLPSEAQVRLLLEALGSGDLTVAELALSLGAGEAELARITAMLAKMGLIALQG